MKWSKMCRVVHLVVQLCSVTLLSVLLHFQFLVTSSTTLCVCMFACMCHVFKKGGDNPPSAFSHLSIITNLFHTENAAQSVVCSQFISAQCNNCVCITSCIGWNCCSVAVIVVAISNDVCGFAMQAASARDATAKCLYGSLFDWIVLQINATLLSKHGSRPHKANPFTCSLSVLLFKVHFIVLCCICRVCCFLSY